MVEHSCLLVSYSAEKLAKFRGPKSLIKEIKLTVYIPVLHASLGHITC